MKYLKILSVVCTTFVLTNCNTIPGSHNMPGKENLRTPQMMSETFHVSGNCETCKKRIENAAKITGVTQANWNTENQLLTVMYFPQQTTNDAIQKNISAAGHDTEKYRADVKAYNALPNCCQYSRNGR